jgi:hypothetical protein
LVIAVVGTASASPKTTVIVRKGEIAKGAVTSATLAKGAVHQKALAKGAVDEAAIKPGAVTAGAIKPGAVGSAAIGPDAVGGGAIAPGSVYGGALGEVTVYSAALADSDLVPHNGEWTASSPAIAMCGAGERVVSGGVAIANPGNDEASVIASQPFVNGGSQGWAGRIVSDFGGQAKAEVEALCLK